MSFYYEVLHQANISYVSICRKNYVDDLISEYTTHGFKVISVSIGCLAIAGILDFTDHQNLLLSNTTVRLEAGQITHIEKDETLNPTTYNINGLEVNNNQLLSVAGALNTILQHYQPDTNFGDNQKAWMDAYIQTRFFKLFLRFGLGFILVLLLANFAFFNHYFNYVNGLQETVQVNTSTKEHILKLDAELQKTETMVEDMLKSNHSRSSFYVNELISNLPNSILLKTLNYQPLNKRIKPDQPISIMTHTILIEGVSGDSHIFNQWISQLEQLSWVDGTEIMDYNDAFKTRSNFSIKLSLSNE